MNNQQSPQGKVFTSYQILVILILALLQFTVVLDFMVLSPLGAVLLKELSMDTHQFGLVVSAYALSAGASGIMAAGFADKLDRKKMLLMFYVGFLVGTTLCALAPDYHSLLIARIVTGLFGGVINAISFAIISDLFQIQTRGRVMGFVQMAFSVSQVLGIPAGLMLAKYYGWHSPFWLIVAFGVVLGLVIVFYLKPITGHMELRKNINAFQHLAITLKNPVYIKGFLTTTLIATGGFMIMPFASAFTTGNLGVSIDDLPILYGVTGVFSMIAGPLIGKYSDKIGKYKIFIIGSILSSTMAVIYCHMGVSPLWAILIVNVILFIGVSSRIISSSALMTAIPEPADRGAFMSINSAVQQTSGGIGAAIAGLIVVKTSEGQILHYDILVYLVSLAMLGAVGLMYMVNKEVQKKSTYPAQNVKV